MGQSQCVNSEKPVIQHPFKYSKHSGHYEGSTIKVGDLETPTPSNKVLSNQSDLKSEQEGLPSPKLNKLSSNLKTSNTLSNRTSDSNNEKKKERFKFSHTADPIDSNDNELDKSSPQQTNHNENFHIQESNNNNQDISMNSSLKSGMNKSIPRSEYVDKLSEYVVTGCKEGFMTHFKQKKNNNQQKNSSIKFQDHLKNELDGLKLQLNYDLEKVGSTLAFIFYDLNDMSLIKCLIIGSPNTSFAYGVYIFDIFIPEDYPMSPPRVRIDSPFASQNQSTKSNDYQQSKLLNQETFGIQVTPHRRLAPKVLSDGRVCLEILGVQLGMEKDNSKYWKENCSLLNIIESLKNEVISNDIYKQAQIIEGDKNQNSTFMKEPESYNDFSISYDEQSYSIGYQNVIKYLNLKYSIEEIIQREGIPKEMKELINIHFSFMSQKIKQKIAQWIQEDEQRNETPLYEGIVALHNLEAATLLKTKGFLVCIKEMQNKIDKLIKNLIKNSLPIS